MSIVFTVPGEVLTTAYPIANIRLQAEKRITSADRRALVQRYLAEREAYPHVRAFANVESQRLAQQGYRYSGFTIARTIRRALKRPIHLYHWERLLALFRQKNPRTKSFWYDQGDLARATGIQTVAHLNVELTRLRQRGYGIRKCRTAPESERERGWRWQYRLWEA